MLDAIALCVISLFGSIYMLTVDTKMKNFTCKLLYGLNSTNFAPFSHQ